MASKANIRDYWSLFCLETVFAQVPKKMFKNNFQFLYIKVRITKEFSHLFSVSNASKINCYNTI